MGGQSNHLLKELFDTNDLFFLWISPCVASSLILSCLEEHTYWNESGGVRIRLVKIQYVSHGGFTSSSTGGQFVGNFVNVRMWRQQLISGAEMDINQSEGVGPGVSQCGSWCFTGKLYTYSTVQSNVCIFRSTASHCSFSTFSSAAELCSHCTGELHV